MLRTAALRSRKYELPRVRPQDSDHFFKLLIGHRAEYDPDAFRMKLSQKCRQRTGCCHIMRAVQKKAAEPLQPARPGCGVDPEYNIFFRNSQTLRGSNRHSNILKLMTPQKLRPQFRIPAEVGASHEPVSGSLADNRQICRRPDDHRFGGLDDAGLFGGDGFDCRSQELLMIQTNARDDRDILRDDIRRIQPSAETDFKNGELHAFAKVEKRHRRNKLKICRRIKQLFRRRCRVLDGCEDFVQLVIGNFPSTDRDAFIQPYQMRRRVQSGLGHH